MTRSQWSLFGRSGRGLTCAAALGTALVASGATFAAEAPARNTVFSSSDGDAWIVSIKPARRMVQAEARTVPVPPPVDAVVLAAATVAQEPSTVKEGQPAELPNVPDLPPAPPAGEAPHGVVIEPGTRWSPEALVISYADAYRAVPFNRAEYDANPSYRHEAAMELLFGQMRPTTIVKQMPSPKNDAPTSSPYKPFIPAYGDYSSYWSLPQPYPLFQNYNFPNGCMWPTY